MITREQALTEREFHANGCTVTFGRTGKAQPRVIIEVWRRNGRTQTWKTRPTEFRVPVKYGLRDYSNITHQEADRVHVPADCPIADAVAGYWNAKRPIGDA